MATDHLKGLREMFRTLDKLTGASKKAATAGVTAGLTSLVRTTKKAIDASSAGPSVKRIAKQTIGKRIVRERKVAVEGKTGFGVGKKSKKTSSKRRTEASARAADTSLAGVGASASNIHWYVLGTDDRQTESGDDRGQMDPTLDDVIDTAIRTGAAPALAAAAVKTKQVLAREAAKVRSKG